MIIEKEYLIQSGTFIIILRLMGGLTAQKKHTYAQGTYTYNKGTRTHTHQTYINAL